MHENPVRTRFPPECAQKALITLILFKDQAKIILGDDATSLNVKMAENRKD